MLPISVCIICKNEESHIQECLSRLSLFDWEIIVVDTGSTDRTIEIVSDFDVHLYQFDWTCDFSAARNFAVSKASNDWILSVDCDEYLENTDFSGFHSWFTEYCLYSPTALGRFMIKNLLSDKDITEYTEERVTRLFNRNYYHFEGKVHEQLKSDTMPNRITLDMPLSFLHVGYSTEQIRLQKSIRNIQLIQTEIMHSTPSCYLYYQLGQCYFSIKEYDSASACYEKALDLAEYPFPEFVQTLMESYGYSLLELHQYQKALNLLNNDLYSYFSHNADYVFLAGLIYMNNGLFEQAVEEFSKATTMSVHRADGVNSYKAYYNIGVIYECCDKIQTACSYYQKCGQYLPALNRLEALGYTPQ